MFATQEIMIDQSKKWRFEVLYEFLWGSSPSFVFTPSSGNRVSKILCLVNICLPPPPTGRTLEPTAVRKLECQTYKLKMKIETVASQY